MRIWRSVSDGDDQAVASLSSRSDGIISSLMSSTAEGLAMVFASLFSIFASRETYGQVSKLEDSGHFFGPIFPGQQQGCSAEIRNGQLRSAAPEAEPRSAIITQHATAIRTISD